MHNTVYKNMKLTMVIFTPILNVNSIESHCAVLSHSVAIVT